MGRKGGVGKGDGERGEEGRIGCCHLQRCVPNTAERSILAGSVLKGKMKKDQTQGRGLGDERFKSNSPLFIL